MNVIDCTLARHGDAILTILNEAIQHSTALYEYAPRTAASMPGWFEARHSRGYPVLGIEDDAGVLLGFASYGVFRGFAAFKYTVEHSLYVHSAQRGRGVGEALLRSLIERARQQQLHVLVGCLDADNAASIALHRKLGFVPAGTLTQAGYKFGRWLDLALWQLTLDTPAQPDDDTLQP
jgi:phosphinothricin acetyltransferase